MATIHFSVSIIPIPVRKTALLFMIIVAYRVTRLGQEDCAQFIENADIFFQKYTKDGKVTYQLVRENFQEMKLLYQQVGDVRLDNKLNDDEKKAFYVNAYTIVVIYQLAKQYPRDSSFEIAGSFFNQVKHTVAGEEMTLNELEMRKLSRPFNDPRIRFVLAKAGRGHPILYYSTQFDRQLDVQTRLFVNSDTFIRVNKASQCVTIPAIFKLCEKDFARTGHSVLLYINRYRQEKIPANYRIYYYEYQRESNQSLYGK